MHPKELLAKPVGWLSRANDWAATHMAAVFGMAGTIWIFFTSPLVAQFMPLAIRNTFFYYSSGWVQLFALPLMVWVGNRLQRTTDAQSEAQHQALTHIATVADKILVNQEAK